MPRNYPGISSHNHHVFPYDCTAPAEKVGCLLCGMFPRIWLIYQVPGRSRLVAISFVHTDAEMSTEPQRTNNLWALRVLGRIDDDPARDAADRRTEDQHQPSAER